MVAVYWQVNSDHVEQETRSYLAQSGSISHRIPGGKHIPVIHVKLQLYNSIINLLDAAAIKYKVKTSILRTAHNKLFKN